MSQWSEIRHQSAEGVPKREISRRLGVDVKTVRRALTCDEAPLERKPAGRARSLDPLRAKIEDLLRKDRRLTAKRIAELLRGDGVMVKPRSWRKFVSRIRTNLYPPEGFVDRASAAADAMEIDFGKSAALIGGRLTRVNYLVAVLPFSNAYYAKAYPVERMECLMDGIAEAFVYFGGVARRGILDNTSLAVREVLKGRDRTEQRDFCAFRGQWPVGVDYCAPGKGWEKGSVEGGVGYVRDNVFRPLPEVKDFAELNAQILAALERGMDERRVGGRSVREALVEERASLRPLPKYLPATCRVIPCVVDKFGYVRIDRVAYSVPIALVYQAVVCKVYWDRVEIGHESSVVATHPRSYESGAKVIEPRHVLSLLERKHRAVSESLALKSWALPTVFHELREDLRSRTSKPDQEWVSVLRLAEDNELEAVAAAVAAARERGSPCPSGKRA